MTIIPKTQVLPKYAVSYVRVSTAKQTGETKTGIDRQEQAWNKWLDNHPEYQPWNEQFQDLGVSGRGDNRMRGALAQFVEKAEKGIFPSKTCLVVESLSRLTRETQKEGLRLIIKLFDLGFSVSICEWGGQILTEEGTTTWMQLTGAFMAANFEVEEKRSRINGYHSEKIERFKRGDLSVHFRSRKHPNQKTFYPFWLDFDEETKKFSFNKKSEWARQIFELSLEIGAIEISKRLYEKGIRALRDKRKPPGKHFIDDVLTNRAAIGEFQPMNTTKTESGGMLVKNRGEPITGIFPPLVTPELFNKVQIKRKRRSRNKGSTPPPRPFTKIRHLFNNAIFCRECFERVVFRAVPKAKKNDLENMYYYYECSAGYNRAVEICNCNKRFNAKKVGVDFELDVLNRLQLFRWASYFTDEKHDKAVRVANEKRMNLLTKREDAKREVKRIRENLDKLLLSEHVSVIAINRISELQRKAEEQYQAADDKYNESMIEESHLKMRKSGKAVESEIQKRIKEFKETGRNDVNQRQAFSRWFLETGLVIAIDLRTGRFEVGMGKVEKGFLVELDRSLEDIAKHMKQGNEFVDNAGNPVDLNHFIKQSKEKKFESLPGRNKRVRIAGQRDHKEAQSDNKEAFFIEIVEKKRALR